MHQLDNNKIPKLDSDGEKYRGTQLIHQLPRQDLSEDYGRHLKTPSQKQGFDDFRKMRDYEADGYRVRQRFKRKHGWLLFFIAGLFDSVTCGITF